MQSAILYILAGLCWLPVVYLQTRMRDIAVEALADNLPLPPLYAKYSRYWLFLGVPAFFCDDSDHRADGISLIYTGYGNLINRIDHVIDTTLYRQNQDVAKVYANNGLPQLNIFASSSSVHEHSKQARLASPFESWQYFGSCAFSTVIFSKYFSQ